MQVQHLFDGEHQGAIIVIVCGTVTVVVTFVAVVVADIAIVVVVAVIVAVVAMVTVVIGIFTLSLYNENCHYIYFLDIHVYT